MVWMQNLMKKSRKQTLSPSSAVSPSSTESSSSSRTHRGFFGSKNKRRSVRKDSGITEGESLSSQGSYEKTENAPWRVENIRSAPPTAEEWWEETTFDSMDSHDCSEVNTTIEEFESFDKIVIKSFASSTRFHNCGLETWQQARKEWKRRTVNTLPSRPTPAEYNHLVKGLTKASGQGKYELPRRMALSDLIDVYSDIWDIRPSS